MNHYRKVYDSLVNDEHLKNKLNRTIVQQKKQLKDAVNSFEIMPKAKYKELKKEK